MSKIDEKIKKRKKVLRIVLISLGAVVLLVAGVGVYLLALWQNGVRLNRETMFVAEQQGEITFERKAEVIGASQEQPAQPLQTPVIYEGKPTVEFQGGYYVFNEDVFSVLFLGVDTTDEEQFKNIGVTAHQADSLILAAVNPVENSLIMINIPRMTITDVRQLDPAFNYARTTKSPICIQYAFGDGKALSCTLTRDAVSNLLFNIPISNYITMNLDGLYTANDAVGGVTVTLLDDMTAFNPKMEKGAEYKLLGDDAEIYLSRRIGRGLDGANMSRAQRHIQYYKAFFSAAKEKLKESPTFAIDLFNAMGGSVQSDMSLDEMVFMSQIVLGMNIGDENVHTIEGVIQNEDFYVDDDALKALLIKVFYEEVPS